MSTPASPSEALAEVRAALDRLAAAANGVANEYGETLGVRRMLSDVTRLRDDLAELGDPKPGHRPPSEPKEYVVIDDRPYDESMWADAESESQHAL